MSYLCTDCRIIGHGAGIPDVFHSQDFDIIIVGYVIMRLALVTQWLRAAKHDSERRITAYRYAVGIVLVQIGWLVANFAHALSIPLFYFWLWSSYLFLSMQKNILLRRGILIIL